jgi:hypothetical protein
MTFVKNQQYLGLIGLSPLISNHLYILQHIKVQPKGLFEIGSLSFGFNYNNFKFFFIK